MKPTVLKRMPDGVWVVEWMSNLHHVKFDSTDLLEFVSGGLIGKTVKIEITPRGEIISITNLRDDSIMDELHIPHSHSLRLDLSILKPYKVKVDDAVCNH